MHNRAERATWTGVRHLPKREKCLTPLLVVAMLVATWLSIPEAQALTVADVHRAAKTWLKPEAFVVLMIGDVDAIVAAAGPEGFGVQGTPVRLALPDPYTLERPVEK